MHPPAESLHLAYRLDQEAQEAIARWDRTMAAEPALQPIRWHVFLQRYLRSATVAASTQIEGNPLSLNEVDAVLQGEAMDVPPQVRNEPINYSNALSAATSLALTDSFEWSEATLRMLNHQVLRDDPDDRQGRYREEPVTVTGFYHAPHPRLVPGLMSALVQWLRSSEDHPLIRVALLHLNLVAVHPWVNGNGRTARIASSLELMRSNVSAPELISVEPYLRQHQDEYFDQLRTTLGPTYDPERHTASHWVNYYIRVSANRLGFDERMEDAWPHDIGTMVDALQTAHNPSDWGPVLLVAAIAPIRTRSIAHVLGRSMSAVRAMLAAMEREEWLVHHGRTRGRHYLPGPRLQALTLRTPEIVRRHVEGDSP